MRRALTAAGLAMIAFGAAGLLRNADETMPLNWAVFFVGGLAAHDGLLAPAVIAGGLVLARLVAPRFRPTVQGALLVSGALLAVAIPPLTGNGRLANNPSILPQDYGDGLLTALAVVWSVAALLLLRVVLLPARSGARPADPRSCPHEPD